MPTWKIFICNNITYLHIPVNYIIIMTIAQCFQYLSHVMTAKPNMQISYKHCKEKDGHKIQVVWALYFRNSKSSGSLFTLHVI